MPLSRASPLTLWLIQRAYPLTSRNRSGRSLFHRCAGAGRLPWLMNIKTLILRTAGTNCDQETAHAFELAGAQCDFVHINRILENKSLMENYGIAALPGGFSYGDDIAAGKILANQIMNHLRDAISKFLTAGKPVIGICNGFQVLVKTELLPG